jgi:hypothetical protein
MKTLTEKKRQWMWFAGLWCGGLAAVLLLAYLIRWMMRIP